MEELLIIAAAVFGYAMVSQRLSVGVVTAPMVFTGIGLALGESGLGWFRLDITGETVEPLVEATLVLVLFTDAIRIDLRALRSDAGIPARLLAVGMPITIGFGALVAFWLFDGISWAEAALLAAVLAPTDAALGQAVVTDRRLPVRIRQSLNAESGLNDGIALPVVVVLIGVVAMEAGDATALGLAEIVLRQVGLGAAAGVAAGFLAGRVFRHQARAGRVTAVYRQLATIAVAAAAFAGASLLDGNGFIAAFVAGIAFSRAARDECRGVEEFTEDEGVLLMATTFLIFGAVVGGPLLEQTTWRVWLYAALSLTLIRLVPVALSMLGSKTYIETRLFLAWFGPRGLATILFALVVLNELASPQSELIATASVTAVVLSIYAHGLTATPWAGRLARKLAAGPEDMVEKVPMQEMPARWGS